MLVAKICLTGGPCAGKSTALAKIERELTDMGYKVFIINEVATRIINSGIKPFGYDSISMLDFEDIILKEQLVGEESYEKAAKLLDKKCVILCDRGIFDIKSFLSDVQFDMLLGKYNLTKLSLIDSYNLVIHLNTAAKGAEEFYTTDNNKARSEGIVDAVIKDNRCQEAWSFHNNFKIVDNSTNFDDKVQKVVDDIKSYLGIENRKQRKYLVQMNEKSYEEFICVDITQYYLKTNNNYEMRLRKRSLDGDDTYYVTIKKSYDKNEKIVTEEKIDEKTFEMLKNQREIQNTIEKQRVCFVYNDNLFKLDKYNDEMLILEADDNALLPPFVKVIKEVSFDDNYKNRNIKIKEIKNDLYKRKR